MPIYFDLTDAVLASRDRLRPDGHLRLQWHLVRLLARRLAGSTVRGLSFHPDQGRMVEFDLQPFAESDAYDPDRLLRWLDLIRPSNRFPSAHRVRGHLRGFEEQPLRHRIERGRLVLTALARPARLAKIGLAPGGDPNHGVAALALTTIPRLPHGACLVSFGSGGHHRVHDDFLRDHGRHGGELVQWIDDLGPHAHPGLYPAAQARRFESWLTDALTWVPHFVCPSAWAADWLRRFADEHAATPQIDTVPLAAEFGGFVRHQAVVSRDPAIIQAARRPFVLCVGPLQPRKNALALVQSWMRLHAEIGASLPSLVFAGSLGAATAGIRSAFAGSGDFANRVQFVNLPSDADLAFLYQRCLFSVYPSLSQSFGLPVGESAWFGRYCVASAADGIAETCGELVAHVDAADPAALDAALRHAITEPDDVKSHEQRIAASSLRRWSDVAADFAALIGGGVALDAVDSTTDSGFARTDAPADAQDEAPVTVQEA
jgi:glycosyltransferase involved in cell wall biosynthesis